MKFLHLIKNIAIFAIGILLIGYVYTISLHFDSFLKGDALLRNVLMFCWFMFMCSKTTMDFEDDNKKNQDKDGE